MKLEDDTPIFDRLSESLSQDAHVGLWEKYWFGGDLEWL